MQLADLRIGDFKSGALQRAIASVATAISNINHRTQINIGALSDTIFANFVKNAGHSAQPQLNNNYPSRINNDGYPLPTASLSAQTPIYGNAMGIPSGYTGDLVAFWTGQGAFQIDVSGEVAPRTTISEDTGGFVKASTYQLLAAGTMNGTTDRIVFRLQSPSNTEFPFFFPNGFPYSQGTQMSKMVICRAQDEALCRANENAFFPPWLGVLQDLKPKTIRCMDLLATNHSMRAQSRYHPPATSLSFGADNWIAEINVGNIAGTTIGGVDTYTCGAYAGMPGSWYDKEQFQGVVTFANPSATATIAPTGRPAKKLIGTGGAAINPNTFYSASLVSFIYDATLDAVVAQPGGFDGVPPLPILVDLANTLNCDLWYNFPHLVDDASVTSTVAYCATHLNNRGLFEFSNENWNFGYAFQQSYYAVAAGAAMGIVSNANNQLCGFYHNRVKKIGTLLRAARGGNTKMKMVLANQGYSATSTNDQLRFQGIGAGDGTTPVAVVAISNSTDPIVQTATAHGRSTDDLIVIQGCAGSPYAPVSGMTVGHDGNNVGPINGVLFAVGTVIDSTHFKLHTVASSGVYDAAYTPTTNPPDTTSAGTYTGGGYVYPCPVAPNRAVDVTDVISYAHYTSGDILKNGNYYLPGDMQTLYNKAYAYVVNGDTTSLDWLDADYFSGHGANDNQTPGALVSVMYPGWNALAIKYPGRSIEAYEGGYECACPTPNDWTSVGTGNSVPALTAIGTQSSSLTNDTFTSAGHGRVSGEALVLQGAPAPFGGFSNYGPFYWIVQATTNTFKLSLTKGGAPITAENTTATFTPTYSVGSGIVTAFMKAYKNDVRFYNSFLAHLNQFFLGNSAAAGVVPSQYGFYGPNQWGCYDGNALSNSPEQNYNVLKYFNQASYTSDISLSNATVQSAASVGDAVGVFTTNSFGLFTFTLTDNAGGAYSISGNQLLVAATPVVGTASITVRGQSTSGEVISKTVAITTVQSAVNPLSVDGTATNTINVAGNSGTLTLSNTSAGQDIVVLVSCANAGAVSVGGSTLGAFTQRAVGNRYNNNLVYEFVKKATAQLSGEVITIAISAGNQQPMVVAAMSVKGATGFDANSSLPAVVGQGGPGGAYPVFSTTNNNTLVYAVLQAETAGLSAPAGWTTLFLNEQFGPALMIYRKFNTPQISMSINPGTGAPNVDAAVVDALYA
jgi:hypothetical protein